MVWKALELPQATYEALKREGIEILGAPRRFLGAIVDVIDGDTVVASVLYDHCDERLMHRFYDATKARTSDALRVAYEGGIAYLTGSRGIDASVAREVCLGLTQGVALYLGVPFVVEQEVEAPISQIPPGPFNPPTPPNPPVPSVPPNPPAPQKPISRKGSIFAIAAGVIGIAIIIAAMAYMFLNPAGDPLRSVTVSFNTNGAETGSVDAVTCSAGEHIELPDGNGLTRDGYTFKGWSISHDGQTTMRAGEFFTPSSDVTLYAQWNLAGSSEPYIISSDRHTDASGSTVVVLTVQNKSGATVDLLADFDFVNTSGASLEKRQDEALSVGPGETTILESSSGKTGIESVSYTVTSSEPRFSNRSILSCVTVEEVSCTQNGLSVRISNTSAKAVTLLYCVAYGTSSSDGFAYTPVKIEQSEQQIEAGQSRMVEFAGDQWTKLDHSVYLFGYASQ